MFTHLDVSHGMHMDREASPVLVLLRPTSYFLLSWTKLYVVAWPSGMVTVHVYHQQITCHMISDYVWNEIDCVHVYSRKLTCV
jgi:hypothetical protein